MHAGLLLAFIVCAADDPSSSLKLVSANRILTQVKLIKKQYRDANQLNRPLDQTLNTLITRLNALKSAEKDLD